MPATARSHGIRVPLAVTAACTELGSLERGDPLAGQQLDAVRAVEGADHRADLGAEDPLQRDLLRKDRRHLHAELGQGGRHLAADEAHADDNRAASLPGGALDRVAVGHRAQVVDAGQVRGRDCEPTGLPTGGDQQALIAELLT